MKRGATIPPDIQHQGESTSSRSWMFALLIVLVVAAGLRFTGLTTQSHWMDEIHSAAFSNPSHSLTEVLELTGTRDAHPPLYQVLLWLHYNLFGFTEFSGRLFSAVLGFLGVILLFILGSRLINARAGLMATAIGSPMFFLVYYSQEVRSYALVFCLTIAVTLSLVWLKEKPGLGRMLSYALLASALIYTHYFGFFVLAGHVCYVSGLVATRPRKYLPFFGWCAAAGGIVFISFIPWIPYFTGNHLLASNTWIKPVGGDFVWLYFQDYFRSAHVIVLFLPFVLFATGFFRPFQEVDKPTVSGGELSWLLVCWLMTGLGIPFLITITRLPILIPRGTTIVIPALLLLVAWPAYRLRNGVVIFFALGICAVLSYHLIQKDRYYQTEWKDNWRAAVQHVIREDPHNRFPAFSGKPFYFQAYFTLLGAPRSVTWESLFFDKPVLQKTRSAGGFWYLEAHRLTGPPESIRLFARDNYSPEKTIRKNDARSVLYREKTEFLQEMKEQQETGR